MVTQGAVVDDTCMTEIPGIFACGNVLHVHDLVDFVSMEAARAGMNAAKYVAGEIGSRTDEIRVIPGDGVRYVVPQRIKSGEKLALAFRVAAPSRDSVIQIRRGDNVIKEEKHSRLHPAEMVWVDIAGLDMSNKEDLEVRVK